METPYGTIFLSHSSKDKGLVERIFHRLDAASTFYDIKTVEVGEPFIDAMRRGVSGETVFVLFHSPNTKGTWVEFEKKIEELNYASNSGAVLVIPIGGETYRTLPDWMKGFMAATEDFTESDIVRSILFIQEGIASKRGARRPVILGREDLVRSIHLRMLQNLPKFGLPLQHLVFTGLPGMGRSTLAKEVTQKSFSMMRSGGPVFDLPDMAEAIDFYLTFKQDLDGRMSKEEIEQQISIFENLSADEQAAAIHLQAKHWSELNQPVLIKTKWGLRDRARNLKPWFDHFLHLSEQTPSLRMLYVSERRLPDEEISQRRNIAQFSVEQLSDTDIQVLVSELVEPRYFDASKSESLSNLILGHPATAHYASLLINAGRTFETLSANPDPILAFQNRTLDAIFSSDILSSLQKNTLALLGVFPKLSLGMIARVLDVPQKTLATEIWELIDNSLIMPAGVEYYCCAEIVGSRARRELGALSRPLLARVRAQIELDIETNALDTQLIDALVIATLELTGEIPPELLGIVTSSTLLTIVLDRFDRARFLLERSREAYEGVFHLAKLALGMNASDDAVEQILFTGGDSAIRAGIFPSEIIDHMEKSALPSVYYLRGSYAFHVEKDMVKAIKNLKDALALKHFKLRNTRLIVRAFIREQQFADALNALNQLSSSQVERETGLIILKVRALRGARLIKEANELEKRLSGKDDETGEVALYNAGKFLREMRLDKAMEQLDFAKKAPRANQFTRQLLECAVRIEAGDASLLPLVVETANSVNRQYDAWQLQARHAVVQGNWKSAEESLSKIVRKDYYDLQIERRCLEQKMKDPTIARDVAAMAACNKRLEEVARLSVNAPEGFRSA